MEPYAKTTILSQTNNAKEKISIFKRARAKICKHCPMCRQARKNPDSRIGKILHHPLHADHCPFWNAEKAVYGENNIENPPNVQTHKLWKAF